MQELFLLALVNTLVIAQAAPHAGIMEMATQFGFNAVLIIIFLVYGREELRRLSAAQDRCAKAVTMLMLAMPYIPDQFKDSATQLKAEIEDAQKQNPIK